MMVGNNNNNKKRTNDSRKKPTRWTERVQKKNRQLKQENVEITWAEEWSFRKNK